MNGFQQGLSKVTSKLQESKSREQQQQQAQDSDDATVKAAKRIYRWATGHELPDPDKQIGGQLVHYAIGSAAGAIYAVLTPEWGVVGAVRGLAYGTVVWLVGDEVSVPVLNLSGPPWESPPSTHLSALAAHWIFGFSTDLIVRAGRRLAESR